MVMQSIFIEVKNCKEWLIYSSDTIDEHNPNYPCKAFFSLPSLINISVAGPLRAARCLLHISLGGKGQ